MLMVEPGLVVLVDYGEHGYHGDHNDHDDHDVVQKFLPM